MPHTPARLCQIVVGAILQRTSLFAQHFFLLPVSLSKGPTNQTNFILWTHIKRGYLWLEILASMTKSRRRTLSVQSVCVFGWEIRSDLLGAALSDSFYSRRRITIIIISSFDEELLFSVRRRLTLHWTVVWMWVASDQQRGGVFLSYHSRCYQRVF